MQFKLGMLVYDIESPENGGQLAHVGHSWVKVVAADGRRFSIPLRRVRKGCPRARELPLDERDVEGMEDMVKLCNCADCGQELLGLSNHHSILELFRSREVVADRVNDRPYCKFCLEEMVRRSIRGE